MEFIEWPKTPRWYRDVTITEKLDGTNAAVQIVEHPFGTHIEAKPYDDKIVKVVAGPPVDSDTPDKEYVVCAQSRKRLITPESDNYGFAKWVWANADHLVATLGSGAHFGEWWGQGIQRRYGMDRKVFSLFNTHRWDKVLDVEPDEHGLAVVPKLYQGSLSDDSVRVVLDGLRTYGSVASPGFMQPEGLVVYHSAARQVFKVLLENDNLPKSAVVEEDPPSVWAKAVSWLRRAA